MSGRRRPHPILTHSLVGLIFLLLAGASTWPLARHLSTHLLIGSETTATVPYLNTWTIEWNLDRLADGYRDYWQAPIFYPAEGTFAFSDPQLATAWLAALFSGGSPAFTYNAVLLTMLALNGFAAYRLLRNLALTHFAAVAGGVLVLLLPFVTHERGVLHLLPLFAPLLALNALWGLSQEASLKRGLALGQWIGLSFLTSEQFGLLLVMLLIPLMLALGLHRRTTLWPLAATALLAALLVTPLLLSQSQILEVQGFARSERSVAGGSASLADYVQVPSSLLLSEVVGQQDTRLGLYPGLLLSLLAIVGFRHPQARRLRWPLLVLIGLAFLASLGLNIYLGDWQPYRLLWQHVPGFQHLRSPFRFAVWVQAGLVLLAAFAIDCWWAGKRRWLAAGALCLAALEIFPGPARLAPMPPAVDLSAVEAPAIFLPYVQGSSASAYTQTTAWMLQAQPSRLTLVNGYSGYFPPQNSFLKAALAGFPDEESRQALIEIKVSSILVGRDWWQARLDEIGTAAAPDWLRSSGEAGEFLIFTLQGE